MGRIKELYIPVTCMLNTIHKTKLERGGILQIVVPAISMADKVIYEAWFKEGEKQFDIDVDKETNYADFKYKGRPVSIIGGPAPKDEDYTRVSTEYTWVKGRSKTPKEETHKITFYWRLLKKNK